MTQKLVFLTSGSSWIPPADCFEIDWVDTIGAGGGGGNFTGGYSYVGGGGAWSRGCAGLKVKPGIGLPFQVGPGGHCGPGSVTPGGDTWFNATSLADAQSKGATLSCAAKGGTSAQQNTGLGGDAASGVGTQKYSGGNAGSGNNVQGAGGAAGPHGDGLPGTNGTASDPGEGGAGDAGFGGAGGTTPTFNVSNPGQPGTEYDATHGSGGGGSGANTASNRPLGGLYGGGSGRSPANTPNDGAQGLIVIAYTPFKGAPGGFNMPMMGI